MLKLQKTKDEDQYDVYIDDVLIGTYSNQEFREISGRLVMRDSIDRIQKHGEQAWETLNYFCGPTGRDLLDKFKDMMK